eukprot:CAMPEP_0185833838 /NCGR_PEP_ID=MMETSP1353-20130828/3575_1 /TAXON_ID=1077150 /ORGANISM="Erythrolobus australicus, Strain CCMP3124" /LENGTH=142 /DNA_ID=CAMNT_0028532171 /DNA_START=82 /DNA_END=510 /DNA_ORIENTATION=+
MKASAEKLVVADFYATWCGPCRVVAPKIEELSAHETEVLFVKVDVDQLGSVAQENGITAMPTFIAFRDGNSVGSVRGANVRAVEELVSEHKFVAAKAPEPIDGKTATGGQLLAVLKQAGVDTRGYLEKHELLELASQHGLLL